MNKYVKIALVGGLFLLLILVRANEHIFQDPFIDYFKFDYLVTERPKYSFWQLLLSHGIRYDINALISLAILYVIFRDRQMLVFCLVFYVFAFIILFTVYYLLLGNLSNDNYQAVFYVRRFLIQPIFVLILIPAFYYQRMKK